jgi:hypothetical protein
MPCFPAQIASLPQTLDQQRQTSLKRSAGQGDPERTETVAIRRLSRRKLAAPRLASPCPHSPDACRRASLLAKEGGRCRNARVPLDKDWRPPRWARGGGSSHPARRDEGSLSKCRGDEASFIVGDRLTFLRTAAESVAFPGAGRGHAVPARGCGHRRDFREPSAIKRHCRMTVNGTHRPRQATTGPAHHRVIAEGLIDVLIIQRMMESPEPGLLALNQRAPDN